jgi:hypothetical protein
MTIATMIEPIWVLLTRLLCVLQPFLALQSLKAAPSRSLALNYGSLPPQLTLFKAIKNGHMILAATCAMALLANLLATAFAGLFIRDTILIPRGISFLPALAAQFVAFNGSVGPPAGLPDDYPDYFAARSGAYHGGVGEDQFLLSESNYTRNTSLPAWTDSNAAYVPFRIPDTINLDGQTFEARTSFFAMDLNCNELKYDDFYLSNRTDYDDASWFTIADVEGNRNNCYASEHSIGRALLASCSFKGNYNILRTGKLAAELVATLEAHPDDTEIARNTCSSTATIGWLRSTWDGCSEQPSSQDFPEPGKDQHLLFYCKPTIRAGQATIRVDAAGVLQEPAQDVKDDADQSTIGLAKYFPGGSESLIHQSMLYLFRSSLSPWHNDTVASEFLPYFVNRAAGHQRFTDPSEPAPSPEEVSQPLNEAYARLFAIWFGINHERLLEPVTPATELLQGVITTPEERLFFVEPLVYISEGILAVYIIVAVILYIRRPGRYLVRMPTSIAAVIALVASSEAIKDLRGTSQMTNKECEHLLSNLDCKYGYGSYTGVDGKEHIGIDKDPHVKPIDPAFSIDETLEIEMQSTSKDKDKKSASSKYTALGSAEEGAQAVPLLNS